VGPSRNGEGRTPLELFLRALDWWLNPTLRRTGSPDRVFTARLLVVMGALGVLAFGVPATWRATVSGEPFDAALQMLGVAFCAVVVLLVRGLPDPRTPAVVLLVGTAFIILVRAWDEGGVYAVGAAWVLILPVATSLLLGVRAGFVAFVISGLALALLAWGPALGLPAGEPDSPPTLRFVSLFLLTTFTSLLFLLYDLQRRTQARALEEANRALELRRHEAEEAADIQRRFLAAISHELRTPLNGVVGMARMLADSPLDGQQADWVRTLDGSASLLLNLINDVLDLSRMEAGALALSSEPLDPRAVVRDVVALLRPAADAKGLSLHVTEAGDIPSDVLGDDVRLRQVLLNLVGNAVKFTDEGEVEVGLQARGCDEDGGRCQLHVWVRDTGIGIPPEARARVFERFEQAGRDTYRQRGGTGLGLAISRGLVERMGGTMSLESEVGRGSTFAFTLAVEVAEKGSSLSTEDEILLPPGRVLVVDDNAVNRKVALLFLQKLGLGCESVEGGAAALESVSVSPPAVVLMDCEMPGLDGYETTRRLREQGFGGPVIALTASTGRQDVDRALAAGMDDHLGKPVDLPALKRCLHRWMVQRPAA
jgi:signal transduction histidine kinase/CheY-like chemotaxis protein